MTVSGNPFQRFDDVNSARNDSSKIGFTKSFARSPAVNDQNDEPQRASGILFGMNGRLGNAAWPVVKKCEVITILSRGNVTAIGPAKCGVGVKIIQRRRICGVPPNGQERKAHAVHTQSSSGLPSKRSFVSPALRAVERSHGLN